MSVESKENEGGLGEMGQVEGETVSRRRRTAMIIESRKAWRRRALWAMGILGGAAIAVPLLILWAVSGRG